MDVREVRELSDEEILNKLEDIKQDMFYKRLDEAAGSLENTNIMKGLKRDIARLKTVLRERELAAQRVSEEK